MFTIDDVLNLNERKWKVPRIPAIGDWIRKAKDAELAHKQVPVRGSILYCKLAVFVEHTGIYIGGNKVVHLDGNGRIEMVGLKEFLRRLHGLNPAFSIFLFG